MSTVNTSRKNTRQRRPGAAHGHPLVQPLQCGQWGRVSDLRRADCPKVGEEDRPGVQVLGVNGGAEVETWARPLVGFGYEEGQGQCLVEKSVPMRTLLLA